LSSARPTFEMLENKNNVNRKLVFNKFFVGVMIKLFMLLYWN